MCSSDLDDELVALLDSAGSGGLSSPGGLAFGPLGNLYVASTATDQVLRYDGFLVNTASVTALDQVDFDQRNDTLRHVRDASSVVPNSPTVE